MSTLPRPGPLRASGNLEVSYLGLRDVLGGPAVAQKYKVHQNAPFKKSKIFYPEKPRKNVSPVPAVPLDGPGLGPF